MKRYITSFIIVIFFMFFLNLPIYAREDSPILITSVPKAGTHLLKKFISLLTKKNPIDLISDVAKPELEIFKTLDVPSHQFIISHLIYTEDYEKILIEKKFKIVLIIRDPRDILVSLVHWSFTKPEGFPTVQHLSFDELLLHYIMNNPFPFEWYLPWAKSDICYTTAFEKLIGEQGGGNKELQFSEMKKIAHHFGYTISDKRAQDISENLFGGTWSFREGKIGAWKKAFNDEHKSEFKKYMGQLLIDLGYETNLDW